jgi:demethoxyubiquinone hydroxylase (CLK1/Coq7/Cat5 family)
MAALAKAKAELALSELQQLETLMAAQAASASEQSAAELYRQQAALLRTQNAAQALAALQQALALEPEHYNTLWSAGDAALAVGDTPHMAARRAADS